MLVGAMRAPQDRARASELRALAHAAPAGGALGRTTLLWLMLRVASPT